LDLRYGGALCPASNLVAASLAKKEKEKEKQNFETDK
jgi:hypothetical protein